MQRINLIAKPAQLKPGQVRLQVRGGPVSANISDYVKLTSVPQHLQTPNPRIIRVLNSHLGSHVHEQRGEGQKAAKQPRLEDEATTSTAAARAPPLPPSVTQVEEASAADGDEPEIEARPAGKPGEPWLNESNRVRFNDGTIQTATWSPAAPCSSLPDFLSMFEIVVRNFIKNKLQKRQCSHKLLIDVHVEYAKLIADKLEPSTKAILRTPAHLITQGDDPASAAKKLCDVIWQRNQNFICEKSGLVVFAVHWGKINLGRIVQLRGASYVDLPERIRAKRATVNIKNTDNRCFGYAILASKYSGKAYRTRPNDPKQYDKYFAAEGLDKLEYPVAVSDLSKIEETLQQPVNVFSFTDDAGSGMYPAYLSRINRKAAINLLYWQGHYSWIKSFSRLMSDVTKHKAKKHFCIQCLGHFSSERVLAKHEEICSGDTCQQVTTMMPEGSTLKFTNVRYQQRVPFVIYADFECVTRPVQPEGNNPGATDPLDMQPQTAYQTHKPCSVGLLLVSTLDGEAGDTTTKKYEQYFGEDSAEWLLRRLAEIEEECMAKLLNPKRLIMTEEDTQKFRAARECYVCHKGFGFDGVKVRDHDHITGNFRGAAHQRCNLQLQTQYKIPVFFHNFRGYDGHLLIAALGKDSSGKKLRVIGQGMEKYLILSYGDHIVIKDSLQFMSDSLENLAASLKRNGDERFHRLRREFQEVATDSNKWPLLLRKGVYPYDYMDSLERFNERKLPPIEAFFSRLRGEGCKPEDYEHALRVWQEFGCSTMKDYHDLYLKVDVALLADIFEAFRELCLENYGLDPAHYVSAPHLAWDAMLKTTGCELELLSDPEMHRLLESGLRGGVAMVTKRYSKANNPFAGDYDPEEPQKHIIYWDANNLYGWSMSQPLPTGGFRWLEKEEFEEIDWTSLKKDSPEGYIVECDLDYPEELHDAHNDYPLAPERLRVDATMWSSKQQGLHEAYERKSAAMSGSTKLVPNLYPKTRYCLHYRNLKFYLEHGMKLTKVHRVLQFSQSAWMRVYIEKNQNLRAASTSDFEKNFYKLMNNACYGKTCENQRKRTDIRLLTDPVKTQNALGLPQLLSFRVFTSDIAAVELMKTKCIINRPFYVGFTVLDLAKLHMYRFHYDFVKPHWPDEKSQLLFTDTDSLMYEIEDSHFYERIWENRRHFDQSEYPTDFFHDASNKAVIGRFKDEAKGKPIKEFAGLRAKMYSFLIGSSATNPQEKMRAKGIQRAAVRELRHADYLKQLNNPQENKVVNRRIGSHLHRIYSYEYRKSGLCSFDDKRYILEDGISTLSYGHFRVKLNKQKEQHQEQTYTAETTGRPRTFAEARAAGDLRNHAAEDDEEGEVHEPIASHELLSTMIKRPITVRPGLDPEQVLWKTRKLRLDQAFPADAEPEDFLDLLTFVM